MSRGHAKNGLKGPLFSSFINARQSQKTREVFIPHTRHRAATRNLKNLCVHAAALKDEASVAARTRLSHAVAHEPFPEYAFWHLLFAAWDAHEGTGTPLAVALNYLLDKFDAEKADANMSVSTQAVPQEAQV